MNDQPQNDEADTGRIHHADGMGAAVKVRQPDQTDAACQQRNHAGGNTQAGQDVDQHHHYDPAPDFDFGVA